MSAATYVSVLMRSHLRALPPIPKAELLALKESIAELRAIGVNLNQIVRQMNRGPVAVPEQALFLAMLKVAEGLCDHFKALLIANAKAWEYGHAK